MRGVAGSGLTVELTLALGRAVGGRLPAGSEVLLGRDTRRSGTMLEAALAAGLAAAGVGVRLGGVLPTPAVAELVRADAGLAAGAVISASHNPFEDNGIKLFGPDGAKLADAEEAAVERAMEALPAPARGAAVGVVAPDPAAADRYRRAITARAGALDLSGLTIAVDCANGATVDTAPAVLGGLGARVVPLAVEPDGVNINAGCGSTDLSLLRGAVTDVGADLGLAFDGDGDRVLAVDADGRGVDGDQILALCALHLRDRGELRGDAVVATTMSNLGFRRAMRAAGVEVHVADVGDRYVLDLMRERGAVLGGEQSGHLIDLRVGPIGDGLGTALLLLAALRGRPLREAAGVMERFPQRLESVRVARKGDLPGAALVWDAVAAAERDLGDDGRVVVRASGTEPVVRVMVEAPTSEACESICRDVLASVRTALGAAEG